MRKKYFLLTATITVMITVDVSGQQIPAIEADRPDQTESPILVPKNHFQMENGFSREHTQDGTVNFLHPTSLSRYGLTDCFELSLLAEYTTVQSENNSVSGINPITAGFKVNLIEEEGFLPKTSFIGNFAFRDLASQELQKEHNAPSFRFTFQHTLSERFTLGYNLGAEWDGESSESSFLYTLTSGFEISDHVDAYVELYGFTEHSSKMDHRYDAGFTYLLKQNIVLDISGGADLKPDVPEYYVAAGFSFRLKD